MVSDSCSTNSRTASPHLPGCLELAAETRSPRHTKISCCPSLPRLLFAPPTQPQLSCREPGGPCASSLKLASNSNHLFIPGGKPAFLCCAAHSAALAITSPLERICAPPSPPIGAVRFSRGRDSLERQNQAQQAQQAYPRDSLNSALGV